MLSDILLTSTRISRPIINPLKLATMVVAIFVIAGAAISTENIQTADAIVNTCINHNENSGIDSGEYDGISAKCDNNNVNVNPVIM